MGGGVQSLSAGHDMPLFPTNEIGPSDPKPQQTTLKGIGASFWRELAEEFERLRAVNDLTVHWQHTFGGGVETYRYTFNDDSPFLRLRFEHAARRAGAALDPSGDQDAFAAWLDELRRKDRDPRDADDAIGTEGFSDGTKVWYRFGRIPNACKASGNRCIQLQIEAEKRGATEDQSHEADSDTARNSPCAAGHRP